MLRLISLEFEGFSSYRERATVTFPESGATLITGGWVNSAISSGSGKSSIPKAIAFALGYCDVPATELKNWFSKKMYVKLTISDGISVYEIVRDPKLSIVIDGVLFESMASGAEEKLRDILKIPADLASILTYRPQRSKGTFLNTTDAKQKEFLTTLLGLSAFEDQGDKYSAELTALQSKVSALQASISQIESILPSLQINDLAVDAAKYELEQVNQRKTDILAANAGLEEKKKESSQLELQLGQLNQAYQTVLYWEANLETIKKDCFLISHEISHMSTSGTCPTCKQAWGSVTTLIDQKKAQLLALRKRFEEGFAYIQSNKDSNVKAEAVRTKVAYLKAELNSAGQPLNDILQSVNVASRHYEELRSKLQLKTIKETEAKTLNVELSKNSLRTSILGHLTQIFGRSGFLSVIFDEVLQDIERRTNEMLGLLPNVSRFTINISSHSETAKGKVNKKISVKVFKSGIEVSLRNLSGGQMCALELCTDLAIAECIRERSGSPLSWIALDEAMDGFDVEVKKPALEMIKNKVSGLILVIDHSTEIKEGFETIITVSYDGSESKIL